jgi:biopolymer transport protein ExbB/TolQ
MTYDQFIYYFGNSIYAWQGVVALFGLFNIILAYRRIKQKSFPSSAAGAQFLDQINEPLTRRDFDGVAAICDSPPYWSKAVPQLVLVALDNRLLGIAKLRRLLGEKFQREVLSDLEYQMSWVSTVVKSAPMLGLLGTVVGMIGAFGQIAAAQQTGADPKELAGNISLALITTEVGLVIAIPLILMSNWIMVRIGRLQDQVQEHLGEFLDNLDAVLADGR